MSRSLRRRAAALIVSCTVSAAAAQRRIAAAAAAARRIEADLDTIADTIGSAAVHDALAEVSDATDRLHDALRRLDRAIAPALPALCLTPSVRHSLDALHSSTEGMRSSCAADAIGRAR
ncbi:hypothetical protein NDR87_16120 [Nocardia sp. CDC159]|uniref:Secreted protein n=1 Tax=Nocardia pulmonis TaxID=2951408 RepID=A0A9X2E9M2_9NOCA|nr:MULTISPECIES: hypothetical protein [Nocardia]MCM6775380.1 hypothetical protein [Nocardia pulmonis]MCM6787886.1 hypothetical protein [Nocardia sp. CDC159]